MPLFLSAFFQTFGMADAYNINPSTMKRIYLHPGHSTLFCLVILHYARLPHHHVQVGSSLGSLSLA